MAKEERHGIIFDSGWEADFYDKLTEEKYEFTYHPHKIKVSDFNYEPDFLVFKNNVVVLIEIKATYNPWSATKDRMLDSALKTMVKHDQNYLLNYVRKYYPSTTEVKYKKMKYLVKEGFVDFSYKSPTQKDMWKSKALNYEKELKEKNKLIKKYKQHFKYLYSEKKLTKVQRERLEELKVELQNEK